LKCYAPEAGTAERHACVAATSESLPELQHFVCTNSRRIGDKDGNPGDMVNFLILGSESGMQRVFTTRAG